jgi:hypothetical protein
MKECRRAAAPTKNVRQRRKEDKGMEEEKMKGKKMAKDRRASVDDDGGDAYADECEDDVPEEAYEEPAPVIAVRSNFNPLANFTPAVQVGEDGTAEIAVKIPDNLTRYRIWAVAASHEGLKYGLGESLLTAQLPLVVRCRCATAWLTRCSPSRIAYFSYHTRTCTQPASLPQLWRSLRAHRYHPEPARRAP